MNKDQKYSCTSELGAEVLMVISSSAMAAIASYIYYLELYPRKRRILSAKDASIFLSSAHKIFLPLMTYLFAQAKQYNPQGRAQLILVWMVLIESLQVRSGDSTWELKKSVHQVVQLLWVAFLVFGYTHLDGLRTSLFILCVYMIVFVVLKGIGFHKAENSYLIERNPKLIHNHTKRVMVQDDLRTIPMDRCDYIVMGEENHEINICENGYCLGDKKPNSDGYLTISRVFQLNTPEDNAFTWSHPDRRDFCLSLALAKMLRRRFVNLPLDEAGSTKALRFVQEGLIDYIGGNKDIQTKGTNRERNPFERVFQIIQDELRFVSEYSNTKVPTYTLFPLYFLVSMCGIVITMGTGIYLVDIICTMSSTWLSLVGEDEYGRCFFHIFRHGTMVMKIFSTLDRAITVLLVVACIYNQYKGMATILNSTSWQIFSSVNECQFFSSVNEYIRAKNLRSKLSLVLIYVCEIFNIKTSNVQNVEEVIIHNSILHTKVESIFSIKWIKRIRARALPPISQSTNIKEAILWSFRQSGSQLTKGETSQRNHGIFENLSLICLPSASTTETILVWHIATIFFHHQHSRTQQNNNFLNQEPPPQQNTYPVKEREVALALSSYCHYLVVSLPELLPDEVEWTKKMYERVKEEILENDRSSGKKPTIENRCNYAMGDVACDENSVVGKGAKLAKALVCYDANNTTQVWTMLSEFWAEMVLFIAPSDNVKGHEEILEKGELITQLWALLTHAGIVTRSNITQQPNQGMENNEGPQIASVNRGMENNEDLEIVIANREINGNPDIRID